MTYKPLAYRMRPTHIHDIVGQELLVVCGKILIPMVQPKRLASMILSCPPGTGKTSMAFALAKSLGIPVKMLNAGVNKKKDMEIVVEEAKMTGNLVLVLDE